MDAVLMMVVLVVILKIQKPALASSLRGEGLK